jgi:hypothetical protein
MEKVTKDQNRAGGISGMTRLKGPHDLPLKKKEMPPPTPQLESKKWETLIENKSETSISIPTPDNYVRRHVHLKPGESHLFKFADKNCYMRPFIKIVYRKKKRVDLQKRRSYKQKNQDWIIKFLNEGSDHFVECFPIRDNLTISCVLGVPVWIKVDATNRWAEFIEVVVKEPIVKETLDLSRPGLTRLEKIINVQKKKRSPKEIERLQDEKRRIALEALGLSKHTEIK